jgi:ribosome-binding factor A
MPTPLRQKRVADRLQQELSGLLQTMNDPRLQLVTVTVVNVDRELEYANIFVSTVGDDDRKREVMQVLNNAKGFIRRELSRRVQLRRAPEIIFHWDPSPEKAEHIATLLDQIRSETTEPGAQGANAGDETTGPEAGPPNDDDN